MKATDTMYVSFHIGRGGRFNNPGYLTFKGEENFQELINRCGESCMLIDTAWDDDKEEEIALPDNEWRLVDGGSNVILVGREEIEAMTGCLDFDGEYDKDYSTTVEDLDDNEIDVVFAAYVNGEYMSEDLKDAICSLKDCKRAHSIKTYMDNIKHMEISTQEGSIIILLDEMTAGNLTREEWKEELEIKGFCPISVEKIIDELDSIDYISDED